ncbi:linear amide C-N hydrolase [Bacillus sp. Marseille-P3661]|uniref:linear amide C-N hydrolase n=1 Tax=Bacillus sp. Marseille-P3661 TaxID=1936234 RepID=UPI000C835EFB|nr:linear amide C-N hydrolase [Bacillus sp. Marseille-P3661]
MCSEVIIPGDQNVRISARTMDWESNLHSAFQVIPRGKKFISFVSAKNNLLPVEGMSWTGKYGFIGINVYGLPLYFDGLNEKGLSAAILWLEESEFQNPSPNKNVNISFVYLLQYILSMCSTVDEVKAVINQFTITGLHIGELGITHGIHLAIHDKDGKSLVIEGEKGVIKVYDNDNGVLTNSPFFPWHLTNLRNYANLTATNVPQSNSWVPLGNGSGMLGMPGDSTPPSRFVRLSLLRKYSKIYNTAEAGIQQAIHLINRVTLVNGEIDNSLNHSTKNDYTQWEVFRDHINLKYYFRTNENQSIRILDLNKIDFNKHYHPSILLTAGKFGEDVSDRLV